MFDALQTSTPSTAEGNRGSGGRLNSAYRLYRLALHADQSAPQLELRILALVVKITHFQLLSVTPDKEP